jgi:hypothetical protein
MRFFRAMRLKTAHKTIGTYHAAEHPEPVEWQAKSVASGTLWVMQNKATA